MPLLWEADVPDRGEGKARVVRLTVAEDRREVEALIRLFEGVAAAEGWQPGEALRQWPDRSVYFALEVGGRLAGGLQLVLPDDTGTLPCQALWPEVAMSDKPTLSSTAHVAILAIEEVYRGREQGLLFWRLAVEMWRHCVGEGIGTLFIEVTPRVLPLYQRLGWPLVIRGELRPHWGEDCYLCSLGIPEVAETILRRAAASPYYRCIVAQAFRVAIRPAESAATALPPSEAAPEEAVPVGVH